MVHGSAIVLTVTELPAFITRALETLALALVASILESFTLSFEAALIVLVLTLAATLVEVALASLAVVAFSSFASAFGAVSRDVPVLEARVALRVPPHHIHVEIVPVVSAW